eukprot:Trichotokara_eunicae@DN5169_c0_g1_i3.p1
MATMSNKKLQKMMTQPIHQIFRFFTQKVRVQIWLHEQNDMRIEGKILGFDAYMNIVLDEAEEIFIKKSTTNPLGKIMLKGDNVALIVPADPSSVPAPAAM